MDRATQERKMRGRIYLRIDPHELQPSDIIMYDGSRCGHVTHVHIGRKRQWVKIEAICAYGCIVRSAKRVDLREVDSAWRKRAKPMPIAS